MNTEIQRIKTALTKPVVLVGLMGAGKTKIGGVLARVLDMPFVDADHEIEMAAGMSIADIFEKYGETEFRDLERRIIARLVRDGVRVISTGGGAVLNADTQKTFREHAVSIWLNADIDVLVARTSGYKDRPLLKNGDAREILSNLLLQRTPFYAAADITVDSSNDNPEHTAQLILQALETFLK